MRLRFACALWLTFCLIAQAQSDNESLAQKAVQAERQGDFATAISAFEQLLHNGADSPQLRNNLGIAYYQTGDSTAALHQFQRVLAVDAGSIPANLFSGLSLLKLQRPKDALPYLEKAHRLQPASAAVVLALAQTEIALNNVSRANAFYREAAQLDAQNAEAWYGLGITDRALAERQLKSSKPKEAHALMDASRDCLAKAMQLSPGSVHARMVLGESFRIAERYDDAIREYRAAAEQQPDLAPAWSGLAAALSASGDDTSAMQAGMRSLAINANDPETNVLVAAIFLRQSDYAKAEPYARRAARLQPDLSSAHVILAKIYLARRDPARAVPELQAAVKDDSDGGTYYLLATALRELGRKDGAAIALRKYAELHGAHAGASSK